MGGFPAPSFQPLSNGRNHDALPLRARAELHPCVIDREMRDAAPELEQLLARIPVPLVLLDRILDRLLGQAVLELERRDRQTVDE